MLVLDAHNTATPVSSESLVLVELRAEVLGEELKILEVLLADLSEGDASGGLGVDKLAEASLALDEGVGDTLLSAEGGKEDEELDGVDVVGHHNELSLALLNELGHVVETELEDDGLGSLLGISATLLGLSLGLEADLLLLVGLGLVLGEQLKELAGYTIYYLLVNLRERESERAASKNLTLTLVLVDGLLELVESGRDLQSLEKDSLLTLDADVLGPLDEAGEISLGLDVTSNSKVTSILLEEGALGNGGAGGTASHDLFTLGGSFLDLS